MTGLVNGLSRMGKTMNASRRHDYGHGNSKRQRFQK